MPKRIDIVIATRNRPDKLEKTIESIPVSAGSIEVFVSLMFDGDHSGFQTWRGSKLANLFQVMYTPQNRGSVWGRNQLFVACEDAVIYATDDMIFKNGSIETAIHDLVKNFLDNDGVIGFNQEGNRKTHPAAVGLVGGPFLKRYKGQALFYPGYFHFACQEIYWHALKLKKFAPSMATIIHMNPNIHPDKYMDQTHKDARLKRKADHILMNIRENTGKIWGYNEGRAHA